jgi:two-component system OmpR family response regulator
MRVLNIEDDDRTAEFISKGLKENGHAVERASDGEDGLHLALEEDFDAVIVDRMLPKIEGLEVIRRMRAAGRRTPALVLSALGEVDDRVEGLRAGGDDYLVKPFAFAELLARLDALVRRGEPEESYTRLRVADLEMDLLAYKVSRAGREIELQPREFRLLEQLMRNAGRVVTRTMLLEKVWDYAFDPQTNVIDVHVSRLRSKIDKGFDTPLLHTVRGSGYKLSADG